jgi:hypothetical protein
VSVARNDEQRIRNIRRLLDLLKAQVVAARAEGLRVDLAIGKMTRELTSTTTPQLRASFTRKYEES